MAGNCDIPAMSHRGNWSTTPRLTISMAIDSKLGGCAAMIPNTTTRPNTMAAFSKTTCATRFTQASMSPRANGSRLSTMTSGAATTKTQIQIIRRANFMASSTTSSRRIQVEPGAEQAGPEPRRRQPPVPAVPQPQRSNNSRGLSRSMTSPQEPRKPVPADC